MQANLYPLLDLVFPAPEAVRHHLATIDRARATIDRDRDLLEKLLIVSEAYEKRRAEQSVPANLPTRRSA